MPGAAIGVLRGGSITTAYHGVTDVTTGEPVTPQTRFSVGSLTKSMVATVVARLAEAYLLSLDDSVAAHVTELRENSWAQNATLRDLLANRSGLPLRAALEFGFDDYKEEDDGALSRLTAEVGSAVPGDRFWSYTNVGWCLLRRAIETATGTTWEDAMRRYLFEKAGMSETTFVTAAETRATPNRRASGHEVTAQGPMPVEALVARAYGPAGASVVSTVTDLLKFGAMHIEDPTLASLRAVQAELPIYAWLDSWCLGWARFDWGGDQVWGWDGVINGERSVLRIIPERQAAIVLMTNADTGRAMYRTLFADLMEPLFGVTLPPLCLDARPGAAGDLSRFAGVYGWSDRKAEVATEGGGLLIRWEDGGEAEAFPLDERSFLVDPTDPDTPAVTFGAFDADGRPMVLYDMLWGLPRTGYDQTKLGA